MGQDELRRALHEASAGPERDFTGTWGAGRKMRRRRQGAQALGGAALAAVAIGAFAFGGGGLLGEDATINPAPPDPDEVTVTESATTAPTTDVLTTDATDAATTAAPTTESEATEEAAPETTTGDPETTAPPGPTGADPSPTGTAPTGPITDPADPTGPTEEPTGDLIVLPNPCDQPTPGLTVNAGGTDGAILDRAEQLLELASTCDLDGLIELAHDQNTTLSFGATTPEQAFSGEEGRTRVHVLATLLVNYEPEIGGGSDGPMDSAMWPLITREQWPELVELGIATPEDVASFEELGDYLGWRIYIEGGELAGNWSGMIAGD